METWHEDKLFPAKGSGLPRSEDPDRPHVTNLLREIGAKTKLMPDYSSSTWDVGLAGDVGFMWEEVLTLVLGKRMAEVYRPGEIERDGIVGSPDGLGDDPWSQHPLVIEEYKATWRSSRNMPWENWYWMGQGKAYCHMMDIPVLIMRIVHLNGDYAGSGPIYRVARIEFTEEELQANWRMLLQWKEQRRR